jgi:hypothetical protein
MDELNIPTPGMASPSPSFRVPRRKTGLEGNTKRMAIVAGGLAAGLAVLMGVWSLSTPRRGGVPVVQADARPLREKPANPGGMDVDGKDASILSGASDAASKLAPPPETPDVAALKQQAAAAAAAATAAAKPAPVPAPQVQTAAAKPAPVQPPAPVQAPPVQKAVVFAPPPVAAKPVAVAKPTQPTPVASRAQVQLAAVTSEEAAKTEWSRLEHRMPDLLGGRKPAVSKIERDGKTLWRVRTGGFADASQATQFCEKVRSKGAGCTVATF